MQVKRKVFKLHVRRDAAYTPCSITLRSAEGESYMGKEERIKTESIKEVDRDCCRQEEGTGWR